MCFRCINRHASLHSGRLSEPRFGQIRLRKIDGSWSMNEHVWPRQYSFQDYQDISLNFFASRQDSKIVWPRQWKSNLEIQWGKSDPSSFLNGTLNILAHLVSSIFSTLWLQVVPWASGINLHWQSKWICTWNDAVKNYVMQEISESGSQQACIHA